MKFYSEVTKKLYDSEEELTIAEKEIADAEAQKAEAAKVKKADAQKVEDAFKANNAAKREYNTKIVAARKMYNETVVAAKKAYDEAINDATTAKDAAEKAYDAALKEFTSKYESYHMTLKDEDNVVTLSSQVDSTNTLIDEYSAMLDYIMKSCLF